MAQCECSVKVRGPRSLGIVVGTRGHLCQLVGARLSLECACFLFGNGMLSLIRVSYVIST